MNTSLKGIAWGFIFLISGLIYLAIPTYLIVSFWMFLNNITLNGSPIYTYALFAIFLYIISILVGIIFLIAMVRAFIQRKNDDLGIPKGLKIVGLITDLAIIAFMIIFFILTGNIAFFTLHPP